MFPNPGNISLVYTDLNTDILICFYKSSQSRELLEIHFMISNNILAPGVSRITPASFKGSLARLHVIRIAFSDPSTVYISLQDVTSS